MFWGRELRDEFTVYVKCWLTTRVRCFYQCYSPLIFRQECCSRNAGHAYFWFMCMVCGCFWSPYFNIPTIDSVNSPRLQNEVFQVFIFLPPLLSSAFYNSSPPLTRSHCVPVVSVSLPSESSFYGRRFSPI